MDKKTIDEFSVKVSYEEIEENNFSFSAGQYFDVKSLRTIPPDTWLENRSNEFGYYESFEKHGMIWPIAVTDHTQQWVKDRILPKNPQHKDKDGNLIAGLYVHIGNKRVLWAKHNGYDQIEGYFFIK